MATGINRVVHPDLSALVSKAEVLDAVEAPTLAQYALHSTLSYWYREIHAQVHSEVLQSGAGGASALVRNVVAQRVSLCLRGELAHVVLLSPFVLVLYCAHVLLVLKRLCDLS